MENTKPFLQQLFSEAVSACKPAACLPRYLHQVEAKHGVCVIGAGKAAAEMAAVVHQYFGDACFGAVVTRYGYEQVGDTGRIRILTASHPTPDENSLLAAKTLLQLVKDNPPHIPILFLISGGGSSLMSLPVEAVSFTQKQQLNRFLLRSGANVAEINTVRKQLSQIKGGKLAKAAVAPHLSLIISDVVGDNPADIASGPTISDGKSKADALAILEKYHWPVLPEVAAFLKQPDVSDSDNSASAAHYSIVANAQTAIDAAIAKAQQAGWRCEVLGYDLQGEASSVAKQHAQLALAYQQRAERVLLFSGGELTVTVTGEAGHGGPNQEYVLALAQALNAAPGISALACDTDGVDGSQDVAGAFIDAQTLQRAAAAKLDLQTELNAHNSYHFFHTIGDLIITGPTNTNVNDFRVIMIE
ncbi:MAG: DUF4147 domain-containing protein [Paraglaciecola sp.]|nr:DUF4147 domain-containing protein [Paraglaciecola sp.]